MQNKCNDSISSPLPAFSLLIIAVLARGGRNPRRLLWIVMGPWRFCPLNSYL